MDKVIEYNKDNFKQGDILFQILFSDNDLESLIDIAITSTNNIFNLSKVQSNNLEDTRKEFINFYLKQSHQNLLIVKTNWADYKIISPDKYYVITSVDEFKLNMLKFHTTDSYPNDPVIHSIIYISQDQKYIDVGNIVNIYNWDDIKNLWISWVEKNFVDIYEGRIGAFKHLMF